MIKIARIATHIELKNDTLRERATRAHGGRSYEFIALLNGTEGGLLSYEDWSERASAFIYEIFVLPVYRRQGLGLALLLHAEDYAAQLNCERIRLKPYALDPETDQIRLKGWYSNQGYRDANDNSEFMEKHLQRKNSI